MMKVIGEEGTMLSDYISYLKAFMLDAVYLQQNSFDQIDTCCSKARQRYLTNKLILVLGSDYSITNKDDARKFFNRMRQRFLDWNYTEFESSEFEKAEKLIDELYLEGEGKVTRSAEILLKGGEIE